MTRTRCILVAAVVALGFAAPHVTGQSQASKPACSAEEHRQFDFWIGEWDVTTPDGKPAGHNKIEKILGGCVLSESWTSAAGNSGRSYNIYDARGKRWHQTWVDNSGLLLELNGRFVEGQMVLEGKGTGSDGKPVQSEIAWTPLQDGSVKQHWRIKRAADDWQDAFVGIYRKVE